MLELRSVTRRFGDVVAVDAVDLQVPAGQMLGVIGRSGAGKSTLLRLVNRLCEADGGDIQWKGASVRRLRGSKLRDWRRRSAMIFQQFNLVPRLDVITNVLVGALPQRPLIPSLFKSFPAALRAKAVLELHRFGLAETALKRAENLSGGQQQRVAIARAMLQNPDLLLADEPIASLDPMNAQTVMRALQQVNRDNGITVIVNLHALDAARTYCDRIIGMADGRIVFDGRAHELTPAAVSHIYGGSPVAADEGLRVVEPAA